MRKNIFTYIAVSAVAFTAVCSPLATSSTFASSCDDVKFIFARGSGQKLHEPEYSEFKYRIASELDNTKSTLKYGFYELGTTTVGGAKYPAVDAGGLNLLGAVVSAGSDYEFGKSVAQGVAELTNYIGEISAGCPNTKFVLAGYSQGAMVVMNATNTLDPDKIIYIATFGDPKLYLPEGKGIIPDACRGKNLSSYRIFAPNCRTSAGSLGERNPYALDGWSGKIGLWCKDKDLVCGAGVSLSGLSSADGNALEKLINTALASHTSYTTDGIFVMSAKTIVEKVALAFPTRITLNVATKSSNRDTVILLDRTGSMSPYIDSYKEEARRLALETLNAGGRIALYTYGDLLYEEKPIRLVDFGANYTEFNNTLNSVTTDGGGDEPESFYSALLTVMNNQSWRAGATKSIIVLTDAPALNPDRDDVTPAQVVKRSLEIDPVNVYLICDNVFITNEYADFISATGGKIFNTLGSLSTDYLLTRPSASFPLTDYYGAPGDEFNFVATTSSNISKYEWDLDFDGIFETETTSPSISKIYPNTTSGFIQLKITALDGTTSTASAKVTVNPTVSVSASINNLSANVSGNTAEVSYIFGKDTIGAVVSLNESTLGLTDQTSFTLTDLAEESTLTLTPISSAGELGNPVSITLKPDKTIKRTTQKSTSTPEPTSAPESSPTEPVIPLAPKTGQR